MLNFYGFIRQKSRGKAFPICLVISPSLSQPPPPQINTVQNLAPVLGPKAALHFSFLCGQYFFIFFKSPDLSKLLRKSQAISPIQLEKKITPQASKQSKIFSSHRIQYLTQYSVADSLFPYVIENSHYFCLKKLVSLYLCIGKSNETCLTRCKRRTPVYFSKRNLTLGWGGE